MKRLAICVIVIAVTAIGVAVILALAYTQDFHKCVTEMFTKKHWWWLLFLGPGFRFAGLFFNEAQGRKGFQAFGFYVAAILSWIAVPALFVSLIHCVDYIGGREHRRFKEDMKKMDDLIEAAGPSLRWGFYNANGPSAGTATTMDR